MPKSSKKEPLILLSGNDEHVPEHVDQNKLLDKWRDAVEKAGGALHSESQVIAGAVHDVSGDDAASFRARELALRWAVVLYLAGVLGEKIDDGTDRALEEAEEQWKTMQSAGQQQSTPTEKEDPASKI
jgi:hypothetical protein